MSKQCPVCGSTTWDYDIVDMSTGWTFCDGCYWNVKQYGKKHDLMVFDGIFLVFKDHESFGKAIDACKQMIKI